MAEGVDTPASIALFAGFYALAAAVGELRAPGTWMTVVADFGRSPAVRFLTGFVCIAAGAAIYLASPWRADDWLSIVVAAIGGILIAEGALLLAAGDRFPDFARKLIERAPAVWAAGSALFGFALILAAIARL